MLRRIERWFVICSLVILIGGHWAILQSFAWAGMIASFSSDAPIQEALIKTFDGKHPCKLCQFVAKAKKSEEKRHLLKLEIKLEFILDAEICGIFPPCPFPQFEWRDITAPFLAYAPPLRPPRRA